MRAQVGFIVSLVVRASSLRIVPTAHLYDLESGAADVGAIRLFPWSKIQYCDQRTNVTVAHHEGGNVVKAAERKDRCRELCARSETCRWMVFKASSGDLGDCSLFGHCTVADDHGNNGISVAGADVESKIAAGSSECCNDSRYLHGVAHAAIQAKFKHLQRFHHFQPSDFHNLMCRLAVESYGCGKETLLHQGERDSQLIAANTDAACPVTCNKCQVESSIGVTRSTYKDGHADKANFEECLACPAGQSINKMTQKCFCGNDSHCGADDAKNEMVCVEDFGKYQRVGCGDYFMPISGPMEAGKCPEVAQEVFAKERSGVCVSAETVGHTSRDASSIRCTGVFHKTKHYGCKRNTVAVQRPRSHKTTK